VLGIMLRLLAEAGSQVTWVLVFIAIVIGVVVGVFIVFLGVVLVVTLRVKDEGRRDTCYQVFRDLLRFFLRGGDR